jgi:hypothetical protein
MTYVIFFVKHYVITFSRWIQDGRLLARRHSGKYALAAAGDCRS